MYVKASYDMSDFYKEIIEDELNVKNVTFTEDVRSFTSYSFKPQLKTVGPKYGKHLGAIKNYLSSLDGNQAMDELNEKGALSLESNGETITLTKEDLLIETAQVDGYVSESNNNLTVVLDTNLTEELIEEGFVREVISKIQTMRKEAGFEVMDKIIVGVSDNKKIADILQNNKAEFTGEVLANDVIFGTINGYSKEWNVNGENVILTVQKQ